MTVEVNNINNLIEVDGDSYEVTIVEESANLVFVSNDLPNEVIVQEQPSTYITVTTVEHSVEVTELTYLLTIIEGNGGTGSGGGTELVYGSPVNIGDTNSDGLATSVARSDHVHAHGIQTNELHHSLVSSSGHGFYPRSNFSAITDPTINEDSADGYQIGSRWINTDTDEEFVCLNSTIGAAVWQSTTASQPLEDYLDLAARDSVTSNFIYGGRKLLEGTLESDPEWQIYRLDITTNIILFADGNTNYDNIWDDRESLTYL